MSHQMLTSELIGLQLAATVSCSKSCTDFRPNNLLIICFTAYALRRGTKSSGSLANCAQCIMDLKMFSLFGDDPTGFLFTLVIHEQHTKQRQRFHFCFCSHAFHVQRFIMIHDICSHGGERCFGPFIVHEHEHEHGRHLVRIASMSVYAWRCRINYI